MMRIAVLIVCIATSLPATAGHTLSASEQQVLNAWLAKHREYRATTDADCGCDADIQRIRTTNEGVWKAIPDYHPYVATGDFNGDGVEDFAVVVVRRSRPTFTLLIFNGPFHAEDLLAFESPFSAGVPKPAYIGDNLDLRHQGLDFGPPRPKPYRLVLGPFESEGAIFIPDGRTYRFKPSVCC